MNMTGMDRDIFRATRRLTTLLNEACNHWNYLCPYLEKLGIAANMALEGYQKDYPMAVAAIIAQDRKSAIRPRRSIVILRNCDLYADEQSAWEAFSEKRLGPDSSTEEYEHWLFEPVHEKERN